MRVSEITTGQMEAATRELAHEDGIESILGIPGVWEHVSEHYNNAAIDRARETWAIESGLEDDALEAIDACPNLPRVVCVELLEAVSIQCYDSEDDATLRTAVEANIKDGTIDPSDVLGVAE